MSSDPFVRIACGVFVLLSLPYFLPVFDTNQLWYFGTYFLDFPLLVLAEVALVINFLRTNERHERRFWGWLIFGFASWIFQSILVVTLTGHSQLSTAADVISYVLYFGFYAGVVMALESRPHRPPENLHRLLLVMDGFAAIVFLFGLLLYLTILPATIDWQSYWNSSLILFVILDGMVLLRLLGFRRTVRDGPWRVVYSWLLVAFCCWFVTDFAEVLMWADVIPYLDSGTPADILWILALPATVVAVRYGRDAQQTPALDRPSVDASWEALGMGPIVVYAVATPLFHLLFYRLGWADPGLRSGRELLTVVLASVLALMAFVYQQWLRRENDQLSRQRTETRDLLEYQAYHDSLTGLPNRRLFQEHLALGAAQARRHKNHCAVFFCDLDEFKVINDSLGHATGDRFLIAIGERLRGSIRASDTVARLGGDEFAVLVHDIERELEVVPVAEHLIAALRDPIVLGDIEHVFTASIGIAIFPEDGTDEATLLRHADTAMYQAKLKGRNTFQLFTPSMNEAAEHRLLIERALREALALGSFELRYQPIIDIDAGKPVGCEALLRWNHPTDGLIAPESFIDVAEQTGLIVPLGEWVLKTACAWGRSLDLPVGSDFFVAVSISTRQLLHPGFTSSVLEVLQRTNFQPSRLRFELMSSKAVEREDTRAVIAELRNLGLTITIDDMGTSFSDLNHLHGLPVDVVKIDCSVVEMKPGDAVKEATVRAIVGMAHALELKVVAEGVETENEFDLVRRLGCDFAQGTFLFGDLVAADVKRLLTTEN